MNNKNRNRNNNIRNIALKKYWDYIISFIFLCTSAVTMYFLYVFQILPTTLFIFLTIGVILINLIFFLTILLKKFPIWAMWTRRVFLLLCSGCLIFASFTTQNIYGALQAITQPETATTVNVSLITLKDGGARHIEDLSGKKIGIQTASDASNSQYVKEQLEKESELKNTTYVESIDYVSLYDDLKSGEIDALIITDYYFTSLLKDDYPTIEEDIFILKSYQKEKEISVSASTKDIRYEPFTVYIAGIDEGNDPSIDARNDVNIVLMVNPLANHIEMISIPRDAFIPNPALSNVSDKLTHLGLNGVENSMKGLENVLGFELDFYVKLNFFSVIDIIDAIGEIEVDVPVSFCEQDENRSFAEEDLICLNEGTQNVNGKQALAFARHRKSYTDIMRGKAQQEVIEGILGVLTTPSGAANINNVMKVAPKSVSTNMPFTQVTNFISMQLEHLKPWTINSISLENGVNSSLITASMSIPLSVMLLNYNDILTVFDTYQEMINQMQFSSFNFHLDTLKDGRVQKPDNPVNIVWVGSNTSAYEAEDDPIEETPEVPEVPSEPTVPEKPVVPDEPNIDEPTQPEDPENPEDPEVPEVPEVPEQPDTPTKPEKPEETPPAQS